MENSVSPETTSHQGPSVSQLIASIGVLGSRSFSACATSLARPAALAGIAVTAETPSVSTAAALERAKDMWMARWAAREIGSAHVCTPVTNAQPVCRLLLDKKK